MSGALFDSSGHEEGSTEHEEKRSTICATANTANICDTVPAINFQLEKGVLEVGICPTTTELFGVEHASNNKKYQRLARAMQAWNRAEYSQRKTRKSTKTATKPHQSKERPAKPCRRL